MRSTLRFLSAVLFLAALFDLFNKQKLYRQWIEGGQHHHLPENETFEQQGDLIRSDMLMNEAYMVTHVVQRLERKEACSLLHPVTAECYFCGYGNEFNELGIQANHQISIYEQSKLHNFSLPEDK